eukprot:7913472-Alexandrium_andersonii.AAC.1
MYRLGLLRSQAQRLDGPEEPEVEEEMSVPPERAAPPSSSSKGNPAEGARAERKDGGGRSATKKESKSKAK